MAGNQGNDFMAQIPVEIRQQFQPLCDAIAGHIQQQAAINQQQAATIQTLNQRITALEQHHRETVLTCEGPDECRGSLMGTKFICAECAVCGDKKCRMIDHNGTITTMK